MAMELARLQVVYGELVRSLDLRLSISRAQQQRAATWAAADGVLLGFIASARGTSVTWGWAPSAIALVFLAFGLIVAIYALWGVRIPSVSVPLKADGDGLSLNAYLAGNPEPLLEKFCKELHEQVYNPDLLDLEAKRENAITAQAILLCLALVPFGIFAALSVVWPR